MIILAAFCASFSHLFFDQIAFRNSFSIYLFLSDNFESYFVFIDFVIVFAIINCYTLIFFCTIRYVNLSIPVKIFFLFHTRPKKQKIWNISWEYEFIQEDLNIKELTLRFMQICQFLYNTYYILRNLYLHNCLCFNKL